MADIQITGLTSLQNRLNKAIEQSPRVVARILSRRLTQAVAYAKENYLTGGTTNRRLGVRTGALRASFSSQVTQAGGEVSATIGYILPMTRRGGDPLVYARIHEGWPDNRSATRIVPRRAQYLAVPMRAALTPTGMPRGGPRDFPNTFIQRTARGLFVLQKRGRGRGARIIPLFRLVREVTIPARPALRPTMQRFLPLILDDLGKALTSQLGG